MHYSGLQRAWRFHETSGPVCYVIDPAFVGARTACRHRVEMIVLPGSLLWAGGGPWLDEINEKIWWQLRDACGLLAPV